MEKAEAIYIEDRKKWRSWLQKNHKSKEGVWLIYYKKRTGKPSVSYRDAVEEAICFGWIDGKVKKIDDERYMQRFTPRKIKSLWSDVNVERAKKMIEQGAMTGWGLKIYQDGKKANKTIPSSRNFSVPDYFKETLMKNKRAWANFTSFAPSAKLAYVYWVDIAKTEETRRKRMAKTVTLIAQNKKFGEK